MKPSPIQFTLIFFIAFLLSACGSEKKAAESQDFVINVQRSGAKIIMTCQYGCAWTDLSFNTRENQPTAINQYGMAPQEAESAPESDQEALSRFLFNIERTDNGVILRGKQGTAWTSLSFSLQENEEQAINHKGMIR